MSCNNPQDGCELLSWDFETGLGDWNVPVAGTRLANVPDDLALSTVQAHGGTHSAKAGVIVNGDSSDSFSFNYWFCGSGRDYHYLDLSGKTMRFWVYIAPRGSAGSAHECVIGVNTGPEGTVNAGPWVSVRNNQWTSLSYQLPSAARESVNFDVSCDLDASTPWMGDVYIDDISLR